MHKTIDVFTFNGEVDILELRLNILNDVVDRFVIVESPTTFTGKYKPLYFEEQKERFIPWLDKIQHYVVKEKDAERKYGALADSSPNVPKDGPKHWRREFIQKEAIKDAISWLDDDDLVFIGDVDEIWEPNAIYADVPGVIKLGLRVYPYYLNLRSNEQFWGTIVTHYRDIKDGCLNHLRSHEHEKVDISGWHFTSQGGIDEVRRKLNDSYTEESYNTQEVQEKLSTRFGNSDYIGRGFSLTVDESDWPQYLKDNKETWQHLMKPSA